MSCPSLSLDHNPYRDTAGTAVPSNTHMLEWFKRNFTFPAFLALTTILIVAAVTVQVQATAIIQLQQGMIEFRGQMKEELNKLEGRVKDVESFNSSINVILTRLGYIEASLNELKRRP